MGDVVVTHGLLVQDRETVGTWTVARDSDSCSYNDLFLGLPCCGDRRRWVKGFPQCLRAPRGQEKQLLIFRAGLMLAQGAGGSVLHTPLPGLGSASPTWDSKEFGLWTTLVVHG